MMNICKRWFTFVPSTSDRERDFATLLARIKKQQLGLRESAYEEYAKIVIDIDRHDRATTIALARKIWTDQFGDVRTAERERRIDIGSTKRKMEYDASAITNTEVSFIRKRRVDVCEGLKGYTLPTEPESENEYEQTDRHKTVTDLQTTKNRRNGRRILNETSATTNSSSGNGTKR